MFEDWKEAIRKTNEAVDKEEVKRSEAAEKVEAVQEAKAKKVQYNWGEGLSVTIHLFSFLLVGTVLMNAAIYLYIYWLYDLFALLWMDTVVCILAAVLVICWAICWWAQLCPKINTAKHPLKKNKTGFFFLTIALWVRIDIVIATALQNAATASAMIFNNLLSFGVMIVIVFGIVWLEYRQSTQYKKISFIEYCNMSAPEN